MHPDDLALALNILAAPCAEKAKAWRLELPPPRGKTLREYRVATWFDDRARPLEHEAGQCYQTVVEQLLQAGVAVNQQARPAFDFAYAHRIFVSLLLSLKSPGMPFEQFRQLTLQADQLIRP